MNYYSLIEAFLIMYCLEYQELRRLMYPSRLKFSEIEVSIDRPLLSLDQHASYYSKHVARRPPYLYVMRK